MIQPIDFDKPIYNAVNINIRKPEVNAGAKSEAQSTNPLTVNNNNGIYNAVKINIDNPKVNTEPQKIYDYPEAQQIVTYEMLHLDPIMVDTKEDEEAELNIPAEEEKTDNTEEENSEETEIPAPNYTTLEAEKEEITEKKTPDVTTKLSFRAAEKQVKKPEIIASEPILPKVDVIKVTKNLTSNDKDVQAQQIEEMFRAVLTDKELAKHYLVSDIFSELIKITEEDATKLQPPTKNQIEARQKLIANIIAVERDKKTADNLPYKMSEEEMMLATDLSPMELVERNKEYAIAALGALAELFIEDFEAKEGRIVPITDVPGVSAVVNALRKDPDSSVKITAIDALIHIRRPEYKEELAALFTLAQTDPNPKVSQAATAGLEAINKIK